MARFLPVGLMLFAGAARGAEEDVYQGRTVKEWASSAIRAANEEDRRKALNGLIAIGPHPHLKSAVPALLAYLADEKSGVTNLAAQALGELRFDPETVVPRLTAALDGMPGDGDAAARALGKFGADAKSAVPALAAALKPDRAPLWPGVLDGLGGIGAEAAPAVPAIIRIITDKKPDSGVDVEPPIDDQAADALGNIGPKAKAAVPVLSGLLRSLRASTRRCAAQALGSIGAAEGGVAECLAKALRDHDAEVGAAAAYALGNIGPAAKAAVPDIIAAAAGKGHRKLRIAAINARGLIGSPTGAELPALTALFGDDDPEIVRNAVLVAVMKGSDASVAVPALEKLNGHPDSGVRAAAKAALAAIRREK